MKIKLIAFLFFICYSCSFADVKILGRDYNVNDIELKPVSFGLASWTIELETLPAVYADISLIYLFENRLRLGIGVVVADYNDRIRVRMQSSVSSLLFERVVVGFYYCPFYNLDPRSKDPFGLMLGVGINI